MVDRFTEDAFWGPSYGDSFKEFPSHGTQAMDDMGRQSSVGVVALIAAAPAWTPEERAAFDASKGTMPNITAWKGYVDSRGFPVFYHDGKVWRNTVTDAIWDGKK